MAFLCCHFVVWKLSLVVRAFVIGLSQIPSYFSSKVLETPSCNMFTSVLNMCMFGIK